MGESQTSAARLEARVLAGGYCIGCGVCTLPEASPFVIKMNPLGQYQAVLEKPLSSAETFDHEALDYEALCPFGAKALTPAQIAEQRPWQTDAEALLPQMEGLGFFRQNYAGYVTEAAFRSHGSSGGLATWVLHELLRLGWVDRVIHVIPKAPEASSDAPLFAFAVSTSLEAVKAGAGSRYYPVELSGVLEHLVRWPGRYAVIGLPCFIRSLRLLAQADARVAERVQFTLGLVCGHLKSTGFAESLAWQLGVAPDQLETIDFRVKVTGQPASAYGVQVQGAGCKKQAAAQSLLGADWGAGAFKYLACDFCDDVFAETADAVVGDAWLPEYAADDQGTNVLCVRHPVLFKLIEAARTEGRLHLEPLAPERMLASQAAGLRHRRGALGYRRLQASQQGHWVPPSGQQAKVHLNAVEKKRQDQRLLLRRLSFQAFANAKREGDLKVFIRAFKPAYLTYQLANKKTWPWLGRPAWVKRILSGLSSRRLK